MASLIIAGDTSGTVTLQAPVIAGSTTLTLPNTSGTLATTANTPPAGTLISFTGSTAPAGYLVCPTSATNISRTVYADLFAAIGTIWGVGDGSTTFGLPWFPADYAPVQSSSNVGTSSVGVVLAHTHGIPLNAGGGNKYSYGLTAGNSLTQPSIEQTPAGGSANLAAGVRVLYCIKY